MVELVAVDEESVGLRGIHRLAGAVLVQAIEDIRCGSGRKKLDALQWIQDPGEEQFSFIFCCRVLGRDPEEVRRFLERRQIPGWMTPARIGQQRAHRSVEWAR